MLWKEKKWRSAAAEQSICVNERNSSVTVRLQGAEVEDYFEYIKVNGPEKQNFGKEEKRCVQVDWNGWRKVSGGMCDK